MVKTATQSKNLNCKNRKRALNVIQKKKNVKTFVCKEFDKLPVDILVEIFRFLPKDTLSSVEHQCRLFRIAVGYIRREEWNMTRKKLDSTIKSMIDSNENEKFNFQSDHLKFHKKLTFLRKMRQYFGILESLIPGYDKIEHSVWCMVAKSLDDVIKEQNRVLDEIITSHYSRFYILYENSYEFAFPFLEKFLENYFTNIEPTLMNLNSNEPYSIGIFRLLNSSWSSTSKIDIFTPNDTEISVISFSTNLKCFNNILNKLEINDFNDLEDETINSRTKLIKLKKIIFHLIYIIDGENLKSTYQDIRNFNIDFQNSLNGDGFQNELFDKLAGLQQSYLQDSNNRLEYVTKYYKTADIKKKEIKVFQSYDFSQPNIHINNVEIDLTFACNRSCLPDPIKIRDKNINLEDNDYDYNNTPDYYCQNDSTTEENVKQFFEYSYLRNEVMKNRRKIYDNECYMKLDFQFSYSNEATTIISKNISCKIFGEI